MEKKMEDEMEISIKYTALYVGSPKLGNPFWGVPIIRIIVYWGLYWGPLISASYHIA